MAQPWAKSFLHSKPWLRCRAGYIQERVRMCRAGYIQERVRIDGGLCEVCHEKPGYIVHHKILLTPENIQDPEVALNWEHLSYECKDCHDLHPGHGVKRSILPVCEFDSDGNPIQIRPEFEWDRT